jgi:hypothetical protein
MIVYADDVGAEFDAGNAVAERYNLAGRAF